MPALPALAPSDGNARAPVTRSKSTRAKDDHAQVVKSLCKTYAATTQKLMYVFATLLDEEANDKGPKTTIDDALHTSTRSMMLGEVTSALAAGVEKVIRSTDLSLRSTVLRDLRARFISGESAPKKVETAEKGTQATREKSARSSRAEPTPAPAEAAPPKPSRSSSRGSSAPAARGLPEPAPTVDQAVGDGEAAGASAGGAAAEGKLPPVVALYDRLKAWEARKAARVESERKAKEERESRLSEAPSTQAKEARRRASLNYGHVQSAIKLERQKEEDGRLAQAIAELNSEVAAREQAEQQLKGEAEEKRRIQASLDATETARREVEQQLQTARAEIADSQRRFDELQAEAAGTAESLEVAERLDGRKLESWPMVPGKRVLRIQPAEEFDGRVSQEYRVKDEGGERGVSILMGRCTATMQPEAQCILFDPKYLSDLQAARWWSDNGHRFERSALALARARASARPAR